MRPTKGSDEGFFPQSVWCGCPAVSLVWLTFRHRRVDEVRAQARERRVAGAGRAGFAMSARRRGSKRIVEDAPSTADAHEDARTDSAAREDGAPSQGMRLRTFEIDADTVEYRVCRSTRYALTSSMAPLCLLVSVCLVGAISLGEGIPEPAALGRALLLTLRGSGGSLPFVAWLILGAVASLALAIASAASAVVSESVLVMRDVGVQLSVRTMLSRSPRSVRFIDAETIVSVLVNEAVTTSDVFFYLCFVTRGRVGDARGGADRRPSGDGDVEGSKPRCRDGVVLVFPSLRPPLSVISRVYAEVHVALFGGVLPGETSERTGGRGTGKTRARCQTSAGSNPGGWEWEADSATGVPAGPATGRGWWDRGFTWGTPGPRWRADDAMSPAHSVLLVSDFFLPNLGGVELHMYSLAQRLIARGHKVTVLTHAYGDRCGVRHMTNGLKVYYVPRVPVYNGATLPDIFGHSDLLRLILLRERVTVVHSHQAFAVMGHQACFHARTMGYKCVFTDHSLFGFSDASHIHMNKLLVLTLADCNHVVCVSHTAKENTVLRSGVPPQRVSVIPNAVDAVRFVPDPAKRGLRMDGSKAEPGRITVAVTARLAYRKGVHLLAGVIPLACERFPQVDFLIAGDGSMRPHLEEMTKSNGLTERVTLLGNVPHARVSDVLQRAHVFLNCSLTESFCIAILEAACCGCLVVATGVGGVPEVLPPDLLYLAKPNPAALVDALNDAIKALEAGGDSTGGFPKREGSTEGRRAAVDPVAIHERVADMYSWDDVAERVERVYERAHATEDSLVGRLVRLSRCGTFAGPLFACVAAVDYVFWRWCEWWRPARTVEPAPDFVPDDADFVLVEEE